MPQKRLKAIVALTVAIFPCLVLAEKPTDKDLAAWVEKRVQAWQPTGAERRFDEIAWASNIREALRLAREHRRPVFLFTHDGRMAIGRC